MLCFSSWHISPFGAAGSDPCDTWPDYSLCKSLSRVNPGCLLMSSARRFGCLLHRLSSVSFTVAFADGSLCGDAPSPTRLFVQEGLAGAIRAVRQLCSLELEQSFPGPSYLPKRVEKGHVKSALPFPLALFSPCLSCPVLLIPNSCAC